MVIATASCIATYHLVWLALTGPLPLRMPSNVHRKPIVCQISSPSTLCFAWRSTHGKPRNMFSFCPDFHGTSAALPRVIYPGSVCPVPNWSTAPSTKDDDIAGPSENPAGRGEAYRRRNVHVSKEPGIDGGECVGLWCGSCQGHGLGAWEALLRRAQGRRSRWIRMRDMSFSLFSSRHRLGIPCI